MAKLILLNGPPGIGKSTLAERYITAHPLALQLEIDLVRCLLGDWMNRQQESGLQARKLALGMARIHLLDGHDVIVPQFLRRLQFIEQLESLASETGSEFRELVLLDSKENARARFLQRTERPGARFSARSLIERNGGLDYLSEQYDMLMDVIKARPDTCVIESRSGDVDGTYTYMLRHLAS